MSYLLLFFSTENSNPVQDFISSTEKFTQAKILRSLDLIQEYGPRIGMPHVKKITKELFELRIRGKQEVRLLFRQKGRNIYFLHGFIKKTNKTPRKEIKVAEDRLTHI